MHIRHRIQATLTELIAALVIAALIVVVPSPLFAQQEATAAKAQVAKPAVAADEEESSTSQKPGDEGIKVHGHWIIDVKDKDGKLVEHRDFHNALVADGATALISLLTGQASAEQMEVGLSTSANPTAYGLYVSGSAFSVGATCTSYFTTCYSNLARTFGVTNARATSIILSGTVPAQSGAYTVTGVSTLLNGCSSTSSNTMTNVSPAACTSNVSSTNPGNQLFVSSFTATTISSLSVAAGQALSVTVTFTFS